MIYLNIGSNLPSREGGREANILKAINYLKELKLKMKAEERKKKREEQERLKQEEEMRKLEELTRPDKTSDQ